MPLRLIPKWRPFLGHNCHPLREDLGQMGRMRTLLSNTNSDMSAPLFRCLHINDSSNRGLLNDPYIWPNFKIYDISMTCLRANFHQKLVNTFYTISKYEALSINKWSGGPWWPLKSNKTMTENLSAIYDYRQCFFSWHLSLNSVILYSAPACVGAGHLQDWQY